jgi:hypothetical protein
MREKRESSLESLSSSDQMRIEIEERIRGLRLQARKGAYGLVIFVLISVLAIPGFKALPSLPEKARQILGTPPKPEWISMALAIYVFSALILTLARIMQGSGAYKGWSHLFYIACFYIFFGFTTVARDSFWAVFVSGLIILGLENYAIRVHNNEIIEEEMERLERMNRQ